MNRVILLTLLCLCRFLLPCRTAGRVITWRSWWWRACWRTSWTTLLARTRTAGSLTPGSTHTGNFWRATLRSWVSPSSCWTQHFYKTCQTNLSRCQTPGDSIRQTSVSLVSAGDDGTSKEAVSTGKLNQENEHIYNLWCSGRVCCEGMLIQLKVRTPPGGRAWIKTPALTLLLLLVVSEEAGPPQCSGQDDAARLWSSGV